MRTLVVSIGLLALLLNGSTVRAQIVFFEEQFSGPTLDPSTWRTEVLTNGVRWCDTDPGQGGGPGVWVDEGSPCYGVAAYPPYGTALLSGGMLQIASDNGQACPYLVSRVPGTVRPFPPEGDFVAKVRMRYDRLTSWGSGVVILQLANTTPEGTNPPGDPEAVLMQLWGDMITSSIGGTNRNVAAMPPPSQMHEFELTCVGTAYTISVDGHVVFGPTTSTLRPTAIEVGNAVLAYWYPTDWQEFTLDYIRVEVPEVVPIAKRTWGTLKAMYRD